MKGTTRIRPHTTQLARKLRSEPTDAERCLWWKLRHRQLAGFRFRRQHPVGRFVLDFVCLERKLVVEVDGGQHDEQSAKDEERTTWLEAQGFRVLRFWNHEVLGNTDAVLEEILRAVEERGDA